MNADDHAFVQLFAGADEHAAAFLQVEQGVGYGFSLLIAHEHAVVAVGDIALDRGEAVENMADQPVAAGECHELALETDQAAGRDAILQARTAIAVDDHVGELGAPGSQRFHDGALIVLLDVDGEGFIGLQNLAVDDLRQHLWTGDRELVSLAPHVLDQNRQMQLAAAGDTEHIGLFRIVDTQGDVALQLAIQALADLPAGNVLALFPRVGRGVDLEVHGQGRLVDPDRRQTQRGLLIADRQSDVHFLDPGDRHDVPGKGFGDRRPLQARERQHLGDLGVAAILIAEAQGHGLARAHRAAADSADADASNIRVVVERGDL